MECLTPFYVKQNKTDEIPVPCGKCPSCTKRRVSAWSFRLMQEDKVSDSSAFLTLTYDTKYVPLTKRGFMQLSKRDLQLFFKRLRKAHTSRAISDSIQKLSPPIRYYACGEYGGKTKRPHYHVILFNAKLELIQPAWNLGSIHYGTVSGASVGYTLKYINKPKQVPMHKNDDRQPEFALMSKGLGKNYLTEQMKAWHLADKKERMYINLEGGKKAAMPRYYKQKIYDEYDRIMIGHHQRTKMLLQQQKDRLENPRYDEDKEAAKHAAFIRQQFNNSKNEKL